jgi:hypothetical protein
MRDFINELEKQWAAAGHDLSLQSDKGHSIVWMKQQADRQDPLVWKRVVWGGHKARVHV